MNITGIKNYNISDRGAFHIKAPATVMDRKNPATTFLTKCKTDDLSINTDAIESIIKQNSKVTILTKDTVYELLNVNLEKFNEAYKLAKEHIEAIYDSFNKKNSYVPKGCDGVEYPRYWTKGYDPETNIYYL